MIRQNLLFLTFLVQRMVFFLVANPVLYARSFIDPRACILTHAERVFLTDTKFTRQCHCFLLLPLRIGDILLILCKDLNMI